MSAIKGEYYPAGVLDALDSDCFAKGMVWKGLTDEQLEILDKWEGDEYRRENILIEQVESGKKEQVWVYLYCGAKQLCSEKGWSLEEFERNDLERVLLSFD